MGHLTGTRNRCYAGGDGPGRGTEEVRKRRSPMLPLVFRAYHLWPRAGVACHRRISDSDRNRCQWSPANSSSSGASVYTPPTSDKTHKTPDPGYTIRHRCGPLRRPPCQWSPGLYDMPSERMRSNSRSFLATNLGAGAIAFRAETRRNPPALRKIIRS